MHELLCFYHLEKEVDGETLLMMGTCAPMEMLNSCGLCTMKQQLTLCKLIAQSQGNNSLVGPMPPSQIQVTDPSARMKRNSKLTLKAIKSMEEVERRTYLMK